MNEAAILTVRRNVPAISLPMVLELVEGLNWGEQAPRIPDSEAKDRCGWRQGELGIVFKPWRRMMAVSHPTWSNMRIGEAPGEHGL